MRILITGANGFIGRHLVRSLLARGHEVIACVRDQARSIQTSIRTIQTNFSTATNTTDWLPHLENVDVVINAVGLIKENRQQRFNVIHFEAPCSLFQACEQAGVKRVIQISALGADDSALSGYHLSKRMADKCLQSLNLDWIILKPSIVYGPGSTSMNLFKAIASLPLIPVIDGGKQYIQPIYIDDFIKAVGQLVSLDSPGNKSIEMPGPAAISMKELYRKLHHWLGYGKAHFISIPGLFALKIAQVVGHFSTAPLSGDAIRMLLNGNVADVNPFIDEFGFRPKSINEILDSNPATQSDRWHAGLYFLEPLLRFSIAFLWIYTGIVSVFVYPVEQSYRMLAEVGINTFWQPILLYAASTLNIFLGMATLLSYRLVMIGSIQLLVIAIYTILISIHLPQFWQHPFGPISKNIPLMVSILIMIMLNRYQGRQ